MVKAQQDERLIQFLMGLSEAYAAIRRNILMISPMPSVSLAYSLLIQDEKQREIFVSSYPAGNHSSYLVANGNGPPQYPGHGNRSQTPEYKTKKGNSLDFPMILSSQRARGIQIQSGAMLCYHLIYLVFPVLSLILQALLEVSRLRNKFLSWFIY